jgi:hypothetical protein
MLWPFVLIFPPGPAQWIVVHFTSKCTRCLRISSGGWDGECKGDSFTNVSKLRLRWKDIRDSGKNCKLLCAIWGKTKSQVDSLLGFDPNKGRRIGEASNPGPFASHP